MIFRVNDAAIGENAYQGYYVGINAEKGTIEFGKANKRQWFKMGIDSELIRSISNHKSVASFARYNKIDDEQKANAMTVAFKKVG